MSGMAGTALAIIVGLGVAFVMFCLTVSLAISLHDRLAARRPPQGVNAQMRRLISIHKEKERRRNKS